MAVHGLLNIDKPPGLTSFQVVAQVRRLSGEKRVGHAGTLDPLASGVLPVGVGQGTRVLPYFLELPKRYRAEVELGAGTDTYDARGRTTSRGDFSAITQGEVEQALALFRGRIAQRPPPFSALKLQGRRLYELARQGKPTQPPQRWVQVYELKLVDFSLPLVRLEVECGRGFYLRSLAHDLGQALGCGGHLRALVRLRYGPFSREEAVPLPQLNIPAHLLPLDAPLQALPPVSLREEEAQAVVRGQALALPQEAREGQRFRAYGPQGLLLAVLRWEGGRLRPEKVFASFS